MAVETKGDERKDEAPAGSGTLFAAAERIRESAKWLLGSFAAVGVVFAAGLQLADVGALTLDEPARLWAAGGGVVVTIAAIAIAVGAAGRVATKSHVNLYLLANSDELTNVKNDIDINDKVLLRPATGVADLSSKVTAAVEEANTTYDDYRKKLGDRAAKDVLDAAANTAETARTEMDRLLAARDRVLAVASFLSVKRAYTHASRIILIAAVFAAAGLVAFAWGVNPPKSTSIDGGEVLPKTPSDVTLVFADTGDANLQGQLGKDCDLSAVAAVAMSVEGETYQVATVKSDKCATVWLTVGPGEAAVIPRVRAKPAEATAAPE